MGEKNITVKQAAGLLGVTNQAVYKAIDEQSIYAEKEMVNKKVEIRIPIVYFLDFIQREKKRLTKRFAELEQAEATLRR
ncbi:MAG: hypothetical protein K0Q50_732 [Vampirovibrio sp.]|jgi:hypothetical protein|nr:hypothetical protein [Vampirovibrio sp.]